MIYKNLLISQADEIAQLLNEYVISHNQMLQSAGTFKSLFKSVDFSTMYAEIDKVKTNFERKAYELKEIKEEYYGNFADVSMEFFDVLESYFYALFEAVKHLHLLSFRLYETSRGFVGNKRKLSWSEYSQLTKVYDEKVKSYVELGDKLNRAYQALESEQDDFIDDEVEETKTEKILGIDIDNVIHRSLYNWAQTDKESLEDQIRRYSKDNKDAESVIDFLEGRLAYRADKWDEIKNIIERSFPPVVKEELISTVISRSEQPIEFLGEKLDPKYYPVLYRKAKVNKPELERQLKSLAEKWHNGSVRSAMQNLESDLEHG